MKKIIVNIDDLGLSRAVNKASVELSYKKTIHSCSFMSQGSIFPSEVQELTSNKTEIGLHFDLTQFNKKHNLKEIIIKSYLHQWNFNELNSIIDNQLKKYEEKIGHIPTFIDGHQHVHQLPQIREAIIRKVEDRYNEKIPLRSTKPLSIGLKSSIIYTLGGLKTRKILENKKWPHNKVFSGVYGFNLNKEKLLEKWDQWLKKAPQDGLVIMCHPAVPDNSWNDEIKRAREIEWALLNSEAFSQLWTKNNCTRQSWNHLSPN